jgi:hypothetical protein
MIVASAFADAAYAVASATYASVAYASSSSSSAYAAYSVARQNQIKHLLSMIEREKEANED